MINLIAAAGIGRRYKEVGYQLPKLLIPVSGVPMIIKAIRDMPKSDKWIFIVRREHIDEYRIDSLIKEEIADAIIIPVSQTTDGQAHTCLLAEEYLDPEAPADRDLDPEALVDRDPDHRNHRFRFQLKRRLFQGHRLHHQRSRFESHCLERPRLAIQCLSESKRDRFFSLEFLSRK